jgi:hypothetical protein
VAANKPIDRSLRLVISFSIRDQSEMTFLRVIPLYPSC